MKFEKLLPRLEQMHRDKIKSLRSSITARLPDLLEAIGTPIALSVYLRLKYKVGEYPEVHPFNYERIFDGIYKYKADAQALAIVNKSAIIDLGVDTQKAAEMALIVSEQVNSATNKRLRPILALGSQLALPRSCDNKRVPYSILNNARDYLANLLGPAVVDWQLQFTGGATATVRGTEEKLLVNKITQKPSITRPALMHFYNAIWRDPAAYAFAVHHCLIGDDNRLILDNFEIIDEEVIDFVPKNWKTDRLICLQATLNMSLQKNAADHMKRRLKLIDGVDLGMVPEEHKNYVQNGRFRGYDISTIDLKAASDRISTELVRYLLPVDWFMLLDQLRHRKWDAPKRPELSSLSEFPERFSAMGNGFTFELETLVFRAICYGVLKSLGLRTSAFSVFGDDIIVPTAAARDLVDVLAFLGFETNAQKTFIDSPFLESCGHDVFYNVHCRPVYLKDFDKGLRGLYEFLNRIRAIALNVDRQSSSLYRVWISLLRKLREIDENLLCAGPATYGDITIHCSRNDATRIGFGRQPRTINYVLHTYGVFKKTKLVEWMLPVGSSSLELAYMCLGARSEGQNVTLDRHVSKVRSVVVSDWSDHDWL